MGASGSKQNDNVVSTEFPFEEYSITELIEIGKKPPTKVNLRDMIDPKKVYSANEANNKVKSVKKTFSSITLEKNRRLNDLIRYEILLMNYSDKNNEVLKELEKLITESNSRLKSGTEVKYSNINQSKNLIQINHELKLTKKVVIIIIFVLSIFAIAALLLIMRKIKSNAVVVTI
jgi:hypothetical protein